mgnify:CR=1 FL=1
MSLLGILFIPRALILAVRWNVKNRRIDRSFTVRIDPIIKENFRKTISSGNHLLTRISKIFDVGPIVVLPSVKGLTI